MGDDQHRRPISGYRDLTDEEINTINRVKAMEAGVGELWTTIFAFTVPVVDQRWMSIARTHFEEGFSAFVRAIARPESRF